MPKQILLADDSATIAKIVQITFAHEDYALTVAHTFDEAMQRARQGRPDVVLLDAGALGANGRSGYDVCGELRASGVQVPVLILTNNFVPYDEARGQRVGATGYVIKPFETQAMIDKVNLLVGVQSSSVSAAPPARPATSPPVVQAPPARNLTPAAVPAARPSHSLTPAPARLPEPPPSRPQTVPSMPIVSAPSPTVPSMPVMSGPPRPSTIPSMPTLSVPAPSSRPEPPPVTRAPEPPPSRSAPRATLMGIPTVGPDGLPMIAVPMAPPPRVAPPVVPPPLRSPTPASLPAVTAREVSTPATPMYIPAPAPRPAPVVESGPIELAPAAIQRSISSSAPRMPRPSLVPNAPTPGPVGARGHDLPPAAHEPAAAAPLAGIVSAVSSATAAQLSQALGGFALKGSDYEVVAKMSREVIERIAWEVVPELAEIIIRGELDRLVKERQGL